LLVDGSLPDLDRDLVDAARRSGCACVVVGAAPTLDRDGIAARLSPAFTRAELIDALATHADLVTGGDLVPGDEPITAPSTPWRGQLVAVTGTGGAGTSTLAMALAPGLADDARHADMVLLADLALDADQAMLHDARDVVPGVQELVEAHRTMRLGPAEISALTFDVTNRRYRLLLGLRRHRDWVVLRPRAFDAALDGLRSTFHLVVADIDGDLEGEEETGLPAIEDRNLLARTVTASADIVVAVGSPGMKGIFALARLVDGLCTHGVDRHRIVPVLNRAPRSSKGRRELVRAFTEMAGPVAISVPLVVNERRGLEQLLRDGARLPSGFGSSLATAVTVALDRVPPAAPAEPELVTPGSLGVWTEQEASNQ
jgi:MinD-like ATPase involved in chromosome partitioning or flagellar assembly